MFIQTLPIYPISSEARKTDPDFVVSTQWSFAVWLPAFTLDPRLTYQKKSGFLEQNETRKLAITVFCSTRHVAHTNFRPPFIALHSFWYRTLLGLSDVCCLFWISITKTTYISDMQYAWMDYYVCQRILVDRSDSSFQKWPDIKHVSKRSKL